MMLDIQEAFRCLACAMNVIASLKTSMPQFTLPIPTKYFLTCLEFLQLTQKREALYHKKTTKISIPLWQIGVKQSSYKSLCPQELVKRDARQECREGATQKLVQVDRFKTAKIRLHRLQFSLHEGDTVERPKEVSATIWVVPKTKQQGKVSHPIWP